MRYGKEYFKSDRKRKEVLMANKEERTHEHVGTQRRDERFFKDAMKEREYHGRKY